MKQPSVYLKMRVLGAIDTVQGKTRHERIHHVAAMTFLDEEGNPRQFTWRTIQTWHYRYKNHGITGMTQQPRKDKGQVRKVTPEELLEAINTARPHFHDRRTNKRVLYRFCVENGLLHPDRIAQTTFYRFIREYQLLAPDNDDNRKRLAFSMKYANQLWQADTMFGPYVDAGGSRKQAKLIAFLDDASRVLCHGEFFFEENTDTLAQAIRAAFYKRGVPEQLLVDNGSIYCSQEITLICARVGCILRHTAVRDAAAKGKIERFFRRVRDQFLVKKLDLSSLDVLNRQFNGADSVGAPPVIARARGVPSPNAYDLATPAGRLMAGVLASVAVYETEVRKERQLAGIARAKADGKVWGGRKPGTRVRLTEEKEALICKLHDEGKPVASIARMVHLTRRTVYKALERQPVG